MSLAISLAENPRLRAPVEYLHAPRPSGHRAITVANGAYDAGSVSRRTTGWNAPTTTANVGVLANLATLRDRSRRATRNDGYAKGVIDALVTELVGTGIKPLSAAPDVQFRRDIQALFERWTDESDADGLLDFYGQQVQICRTWLEGGDAFIRLRPRLPSDGLTVPLQLQVIEPELVPHEYTAFGQGANRIRAAIEFDPIGRRVAYYIYAQRPGDFQDFDPGDLRRVPADGVVHVYDPLRAGQLRGIPRLTQALVKLYELDKYDDASLLRQQLANMFVGFIKKQYAASDAPVDPLTGAPVASGESRPLMPLKAGLFQELDPGEDVTWSSPPDAGQNYPDFMRQQLLAVCAATGVPYEVLTGDMSKVNDRTVRVILQKFRRRLMLEQHGILAFQFCRRVWNAFLDRAFLGGTLDMPGYAENPEPWRRVKWMPQGWPYIQPVQDIEAQRDAVRDGFASRSSVVAEQGEDAEAIDLENQTDNKRADEFGLKYDSDGRNSLSKTAGLVAGPKQGAAA